MIFRLEYCNKASVTARVDIQKGDATPIYTVDGTSEPFVLFYNNDKGDKSGSFRSSGADINIYKTTEFNIDELKTSNETEISVKYYINNILNWSGFVIPDFFSETITGGRGVVSMVASDRLGTLKGATLSGLSAKVSNRALAEACLAQTGLSLPLYTMADFTGDGTNIFNSEVLSQRMVDTKGRNVSCYDILSSILEETNSLIVQRNGAWYIVNKLQLEAGSGSLYSAPATSSDWVENTVSFDEVSVGARRTITPVAATVGVYHEHGGGRSYPDNYDFEQGLTGWTPVNGFIASINDKVVDEFEAGGASPQFTIEPTYTTNVTKKYLVNLNYGIDHEFASKPYIRSSAIPIVYPNLNEVNVSIDINATAPYTGISVPRGQVNFAVVASDGSVNLNLNSSGIFEPFSGDPYIHKIDFFGEENYKAVTSSKSIKGLLRSETGDLSSYNVTVRIYGHSQGVTGGVFRIASLINSVSVNISTLSDTPKGNIFKTSQGANYTKTHEIPTVLWGDYLTSGLNGYFYDYPIDDTSSIYRPTGELHSKWTAYGDLDTLPLLQHITRQKARMFSVAHDLLSADIATSTFDPLSIFVDCDSTRYVVVSARFDFLRSNVSVELEEIAYVTNSKRDYIYSYFGEGESGISSVGGISSGTGGGGLDTGIIGSINERIDEIGQKMDNIKVGVSNLLRNTGFLGDFLPLEVDALTAVLEDTPVGTNPLVHWVHYNTEVIDAPSRSGKGVSIGSLQQNVNLRAGRSYVLSFMAKGTSLTVNLVDSKEVELTGEFEKYSFDIVAPNTGSHIFWIEDQSLTSEVYEIMLSEGNTEVDYAYAAEDDLKSISQLQAINAITSVIKDYDTDILGGLILTSMMQLGKYKDGVMEEVNAGISGIYNSEDDPAAWFGGSLEKAIRTVQRLKSNPYNVSEEEWEDLANIVFTHGGDGFFKGIIYALGGVFRGRIESSVAGNRIIIDPSDQSLKMYNQNDQLALSMQFDEHPMGFNDARINVFTYNDAGEVMHNTQITPTNISVMATSIIDGTVMVNRANMSPGQMEMIGYTSDGQDFDVKYQFSISRNTITPGLDMEISTVGLPTTGDGLPAGMWYIDNGFLKIKQ